MQKKRHNYRISNLFQIMRISFMLWCLLFTTCIVFASNKSFGQKELDKIIHVDFKNISLKDALEQLQTKYLIPLAYSNEDNSLTSKINYSAHKQAKYVLKDILQTQNMTYEVRHDFVRLVRKTVVSKTIFSQQQREITGSISSADGELLAGVSVSLKEKPTVGTTTDINGKFILAVPNSGTLVFEMVGYKTIEVPINNQRSLNIVMEITEAGLDEVVVVGFGTQRKISLVGAQSTVEAKNLQVPVANLTNALAGRISGVVSVQRTGEPGFDDAGIWIRGISTFSQGLSEPLVLVDGAPRKMSNVDPEDIESFTVLKDAAATAVYGVRGANGVVIIKTKGGTPGKPKFSFRYYEGLTSLTTRPEFADGITYMRMSNEALTNRGAVERYSEETIAKTASGEDPYLYPNVNWMDAVYRDFGRQRRGNLNVNGGSDRVTYYVGTSYFDEKGLYQEDPAVNYNQQVGYKRYNMTSNINIQASNLTKIELGIQGYLANANYPGSGQRDIFEDIWMVTPVLHPKVFENGTVPDQRAGSLVNPYAQVTQTGYANQWRNQLFSNLRATQDLPFITKGLSATAMFSFDVYNYTSMRRTKRPDSFLAIGRDANGEMQYEQTYVGERFLSFSSPNQGERTIYIEGALNYKRIFGNHNTSGMLLFNKSDRVDTQAETLEESLPFRYMGLSGRATYSFKDRYFTEVNFGYNGAENFAPENRYGFFPSFGVAWALSEEPFMENIKNTFSLIKLRFSHGKVGNSKIMIGDEEKRFAYLSKITSATGYSFGKGRNNNFGGYNVDEYAVSVTWETAVKSNLGVDIQTVNNELNLQLDFFKERRSGIFLQRGSVPSYVGLQSQPTGNLGIIDNKGFDASLTWNKKFNDLFVQLRGNVTWNRNKIVENDQPTPLYPWLDERGMKVGRRLGLIALGLFESEDEIANGPLHPGTVKPGDIKFQDTNGDGKIDDFDEMPIGYGTIPEWVYGFGLSFTYKSFSISSLFQGVGNVDIMMSGEGVHPFSVSLSRGNLLSNIEDRWTIDNPRQDVFYPRLSDGSPNGNFSNSTWWLKNGKYLRLKDLQVAYQLPKNFVNSVNISNANIFFAGYNLLTWSPFKFWDVELGDGRGTRYPNVKTYSVGLNVNF
ncbi:TonB-dependent receptor [Sphingobacterium sp. SGG-5]|uniref:SusC/RagA family TonB-linked outer membrane protein n=1 Tax=Sphingobacterium sp. SGG-5 TaxID=2710881 RepID=UPI0013EB9D0E|nr:TonB-dependent receptor [Sphingobacterium sp. SGG-5]NGM63125.1 TonB-dependent receptor [Sphingobacterium sp. SGG-5]